MDPLIELALASQVLVFFMVAAVYLAARQASLFHPLTWYLAFHGIVFVLRPLLVFVLNFDAQFTYMEFYPSPEISVLALAASSTGLVVITGVCLACGRASLQFPKAPLSAFSREEIRGLLLTTLLFLPAVAFSIFTTRNGIEGERIGGVYVNTNSVGYLNDAQFALMPLLCAWLVVTRFHWLNVGPSLLYVGYRTWFGWSRWTILLFLVLAVAVYCWHQRIRWMPLWSVFVAVPCLLLFNLLGHNRDALKSYLQGIPVHSVDFSPGMTTEGRIKKRFDGPDFANFDSLAFIVAMVPARTETYTYGTQYLQLFTEPVPRKLWKGKPVGAPISLFNLNSYGNFTGLTNSLCGDGWMSGGWIGLVVTMVLVGMLLGWAHGWFWKHVRNKIGVLFYLTGLAMLPQWYRDGSISIAKFMLWNWLPLIVWVTVNWALGRRLVHSYTLLLPRGAAIPVIHLPGTRPNGRTKQVVSATAN